MQYACDNCASPYETKRPRPRRKPTGNWQTINLCADCKKKIKI